MASGLLGVALANVPDVGPYIAPLAAGLTLFLLDKGAAKEEAAARAVEGLQQNLREAVHCLWNEWNLAGTVKHPDAYPASDATLAAAKTLADLLPEITVEQALDAYRMHAQADTSTGAA
jgi:hypothetical protein